MPFCDGSHVKTHFAGEEFAPKDTYKGRAERIDAPVWISTMMKDVLTPVLP
jgi:CDGSH-type Zn-finger protein